MKKRVAYCFVLWQASGGKTELAGECSANDCAQ